MALKTTKFLPEVFRSPANRKFLSATLDQLVTDPEFKKINGYIGRKVAPTYSSADNYLLEPTTDRTNYQLEPALVIENSNGDVKHHATYVDLINKIGFYGGDVTNHSRLFAGASTSYNNLVDLDKLVNFNQYWWMPDGPEIVNIYTSDAPTSSEFVFQKTQSSFSVSGIFGSRNPELILLRGHTYRFIVNQDSRFWIQTNANPAGFKTGSRNISSREVFGVTNNGIKNGIITFSVPRQNEQMFFANIAPYDPHPVVDYATTIQYNQIHNHLLSSFRSNFPGLDGTTAVLENKTIVFVSGFEEEDLRWDPAVNFGGNFDSVPGYSGAGGLVPLVERASVWRLNLIPLSGDPDTDYVMQLTNIGQLSRNQKVFISNGETRCGLEYYRDSLGNFQVMQQVTASMDELYYVDESSLFHHGKIKIKDPTTAGIDVESDIIGQRTYVSPNGVRFSNGMRVRFPTQTLPEQYAGQVYYVEGVGTSIRLIADSEMFTPELMWMYKDTPFDLYNFDVDRFDAILSTLTSPEYITINRSSVDKNSWSRSNRWVHEDVINDSARYNGREPDLNVNPSHRGIRAVRPIIEFNADLLLYNYGRRGRSYVTHLIFEKTDAFKEYEENTIFEIDGFPVKTGDVIVFANDDDPVVRNQKYKIELVFIDNREQIHLIPFEEQLQQFDVIVPIAGKYIGVNYWFNGERWVEGQRKQFANQIPTFTLMDINGNFISDPVLYPGTNFQGSKLFGYSETTSAPIDKFLGFPIKYRNFSTIGDIEFTNYHQVDEFRYYKQSATTAEFISEVKSKTSDFFIPQINVSDRSLLRFSPWTKVTEKTKQRQIFTFENTSESRFRLDVMPVRYNETNIQIIVNGKILPHTNATFTESEEGIYCTVQYESKGAGANKVDIIVYANKPSSIGYYEIPRNLDLNALNKVFRQVTLGQMRNHFSTIGEHVHDLVGTIPGSSNVRDTDYTDIAGNILQHEAPVVYSQLFLTHDVANFANSVAFAQREYSRFKNKFLETAATLTTRSAREPKTGVDEILSLMNAAKNSAFPWFSSDMVAHGKTKTVTIYKVLNTELVDYEVTTSFNSSTIDHSAVIVYLNGEQLIRDRDYVFRTDTKAVSFKVELQLDDVIEVAEYPDTDGSYIPETPTKLGLYPAFVPEVRFDNTYREPTNVIIGHDGSVTVAFNDFRDGLLLELEKRIYNNIKIKTAMTMDKLFEFVPGKFREAGGYNRDEFNSIIASQFLRWVGNYRINYNANLDFNGNDPWSWNYSRNIDKIDGERLPGHWRGVYRYFFDTDAPHIEPWVMLGFSEKPNWWERHYGPAPYTGGNLVMWRDIEAGRIVDGPTAGVYSSLARPGVTNTIPVDEFGNLKSPAEFAVLGYNPAYFSNPYSFGDVAPVESAWRRSSDYPYAVQFAIALMQPARYFGMFADTQQYQPSNETGGMLTNTKGQFVRPNEVRVNGQPNVYTGGYLSLISNYLISLGIDGRTKIKDLLDSIDVRLSYNVAGYTDPQYLQVFADQSSPSSINESVLLPDENMKVFLHTSIPLSKVTYSAVIVEKSGTGFLVKGYNTISPFFTVLPVDVNSTAHGVKVLNTEVAIYSKYVPFPEYVPYGTVFDTLQEVSNFLMSYGNYLAAIGFKFDDWSEAFKLPQNWELSVRELLVWSQQGWGENALIALSPTFNKLNYANGNLVVAEVDNNPLGSRVLDQNFTVINSSNFTAVREENEFELITDDRMIAFAELHLVQHEHVIVFDNTTMFNDVVYLPETGNRQFRLRVVGSKTLNWTGKFDPPGFIFNADLIQQWQAGKDYRRGDIVENKGNFYVANEQINAAESFDVSKWALTDKGQHRFGLIQNFATNAKKFTSFYDIDAFGLDENTDIFAKGLIGFRPRRYLSDLGLDLNTQIKFYQGMIHDKGTNSAIVALSGGVFNTLVNDIEIYEEWGIKVGEYGGVTSNQYFEVSMPSVSNISSDPVGFELVNNTGASTIHSGVPTGSIFKVDNKLLYKSPFVYEPNFLNIRDDSSVYEFDLKTAGYVRRDDVDATLFDIRNITELNQYIDRLKNGFTVWVAKNKVQDWDVLRVHESPLQTISAKRASDSELSVLTQNRHRLSVGDVIAISGVSSAVDGFGTVARILSLNEFLLDCKHSLSNAEIEGKGVVCTMNSVRLAYLSETADMKKYSQWDNIQRVWVDNTGNENKKWAVYEKDTHFKKVGDLLPINTVANAKQGYSVIVDSTGQFSYAASPTGNYIDLYNESVAVDRVLLSAGLIASTSNFGNSMAIGENRLIVGASESNSNNGRVIVYDRINSGMITQIQVIESPVLNGKFGHAVAMSRDSRWLYVSAVDAGLVFVYKDVNSNYVLIETLDCTNYNVDVGEKFGNSVATTSDGSLIVVGSPNSTVSQFSQSFLNAGKVVVICRKAYSFITDGIASSISLPTGTTVSDVFVNGTIRTLNAHYTISGNVVTFTSVPPASDTILIETSNFALHSTLLPSKLKQDMQFGYAVEISSNGDNVFASAPFWNSATYHNGIVFSFTNRLKEFKYVEAVNESATIAPATSLLINNIEVFSTGSSIGDLVNDIDVANIPGVSARATNNRIVITGAYSITPGQGNVYYELNFNTFVESQVVDRPDVNSNSGQVFGTVLEYSDTLQTLAITSKNADAANVTEYDDGNLKIDGDFTRIYDYVHFSGAVYLFEKVKDPRNNYMFPHRFSFVQTVHDNTVRTSDNFGHSLSFGNNTLLIGSPSHEHNASVIDSGKAVLVTATRQSAFVKKHEWSEKVDYTLVNRVFLYNTKTNETIVNLDIIDPAKGKILGIARENIDFVAEHDPAQYNRGQTVNVSSSVNTWGKPQIGTVWWDLSTARFAEYEQGSIAHRMNNWGELFDKSSIDVYEWIESDLLPSEYALLSGLAGTPKEPNDTHYSVGYKVNFDGVIKNTFYFWVSHKIDNPFSKSMSTDFIANSIQSPRTAGIPFIAFTSSNSFALYGAGAFLDSENVVLRIEYVADSCGSKSIPIHTEYAIAQEKNPVYTFPEAFVEKLIDSLTGADRHNRVVPDPSLKATQRYGIAMNPRQSMFVNRRSAVKVAVDFLNKLCAEIPIATTTDLTPLYQSEPLPPASEYDVAIGSYQAWENIGPTVFTNGTRLLIKSDSENLGRWTLHVVENDSLRTVRSQSYKTDELWAFADWFAVDYDRNKQFDYVVDTPLDSLLLDVKPGELIFVRNGFKSNYVVYRIESDLSRTPVAVQNGTIRLLSDVYRVEGFDNSMFGVGALDSNIAIPFKAIIKAFREKILINEYSSKFTDLVFILIKYVLAEQKNVDWVFKTSFISVNHKLRKLDQHPVYIRDNQVYYADYIHEVKPYRTKIREYTINYSGADNLEVGATDFDLPSYYDKELKTWRSPNNEHARDDVLLEIVPEYQAWKENHNLEISGFNIVNRGINYQESLSIVITGAPTDTPAVIKPIVHGFTGELLSIEIISGGSYSTMPVVAIHGTGTGAVVYPIVDNKKIRSISTSIKFDRVSYTVDTDLLGISLDDVMPPLPYDLSARGSYNLSKEEINRLTANERLEAFYTAPPGNLARSLPALVPGIDFEGVKLTGGKFTTQPWNAPDSIVNGSAFTDANLGTQFEDVNITGGAFIDTWHSHAPEELVPGQCFETVSITVFTEDGSGGYHGYRMVNDGGEWSYQRLSDAHSTELARPLHADDANIVVSDSSVLPNPDPSKLIPGVIYIGAERIEYYAKDDTTNTLSNIRRGTQKTATLEIVPVYEKVVDASRHTQGIPPTVYGGQYVPMIWLNLDPDPDPDAISDGTGLLGSSTAQAVFIKGAAFNYPYSMLIL